MSLFDIVPERFHLASDDYEELWDAILDHPSPEKALDGDPYLHYRPQYRRRTAKTATPRKLYQWDGPNQFTVGVHHFPHGAAWAECECGWHGPAREQGQKPDAYDDQDRHLSENIHRQKPSLHEAGAGTELSSSTTGDSWQGHADLGASPGPPPSVDFIPFEPGTLCSYCSQNQAECTVNGSNLCLDCAQNHWGIPMDQAAITPGVPGEAPEMPQEPPEDLAEGSGALEPHEAAMPYQGGFNFKFYKSSPRGFSYHVLKALTKDHPDHPDGRIGGVIMWHHKDGLIQGLKVNPEFRRQGLATELLHQARGVSSTADDVVPPRHHSDRTEEGEAWARSLGEDLPERREGQPYQAALHEAMSQYQGDHEFKFFKANPKSMGGRPTHTIEAWDPEEAKSDWAQARPEDREHYAGSDVDPGTRPVGSLSWHHETGEIKGVYVEPENKRQGIATELLRRARDIAGGTRGVKPPRHSTFRTDSGEAWARSLNERRLPRQVKGAKVAPGYHTDKFFHGSSHDFEPGDEVTPGLEPAHHPGTDDRVWVADNAWVASSYGHNTYEVTPHELPRKGGKSGEFHTSGATVVRKVPNSEVQEHSNRWYDPNWRPHEAAWRDVMNKAKRLRTENAVHLLEVPTPHSPYVFAEVKGDNALHHCFVAVKGDEQGQWSCSCNWGDFGPNGPLAGDRSASSPYKKTPCSHILATRWELQSRSMFGRNPYTGALGAKEVLYHGSDHEFSPGDLVLPRSQSGAQDHWPDFGSGEDNIHLTTQPDIAKTYGRHVYEVRPKGKAEPGYWFPHHERVAPMGTIIRKLEPHEVRRNEEFYAQQPELPEHRASFERESAMDIFDEWFMGRFLHEAKEGPAPPEQGQDYGSLQGWLAPHRNPEGTAWKGKTPGAYGRNPRATRWNDLDDNTQKKVSGTIHKALGEAPTIPNASVPGGSKNPLPAKQYQAPRNQGDLVNNITSVFHSARNSDDKGEGHGYLTNGQNWYKQAHNQVKDWAHTYGIDHYHMNGATAALSPSTDWDSNLTMAHYHASKLGTKNADGTENNQTFSADRGHKSYAKDVAAAAKDGVDLGGLENKRFRDMTHAEAYHAIKHQALRVDKVKRSSGGPMVENPKWGPSWQSSKNGIRAIRMMRGETEADSPDKLLSGHKVRSFHNNLYHAGHTDDVTVDSHATSLAMGAKMGASSKTLKKVLEFGDTAREKAKNSRGGYSYIADSYRQAHANLVRDGHMSADSTPSDLQAITWKRWRDLMPSRSAGKKGHESTEHTQKNSFPVLAALDHDQDEEHHDDDEHWLDPWGGPDEPDPDLHAQEEEGWEDGEEPDDFEGPYGDQDQAEDYSDMLTDRRKEGAMYDWTNMLRQARREALAAEVPPPPQVPVQYLFQVPHHLAQGMDEFGFEHQANGVPSEQWQVQHSPGARNPADTAPPGFGDSLDPAFQNDVLGGTYPDEQMLEPGPVLTGRFRGVAANAAYEVVVGAYQGQSQGGGGGGSYVQAPLNPEPPYPMVQAPASQPVSLPPVSEEPSEPSGGSQALASYQEGLEWLRPSGNGSTGLPGASPAMSRAASQTGDNMNLAAGAEAFLRTGSIPVPGMEVNMDTILAMPLGMEHDARSRDFTPAEQDEMVREGELEGVKASNLHMLRLQGSMYEELERQLTAEDQSEASANALWW